MIRAFYQNEIIDRFAALITFGLNEGYSYESIQEHIVSSPFVNALERNEYDAEKNIEEVVSSAFSVPLMEYANISFRGLFLGESYFRLFIECNKSLEYIFLYWPLSFFNERYDVYHEMDFSNIKTAFEAETKNVSLLKKLSKQRGIKLADVSRLAEINKNTIDKYARNDDYLYNASYKAIYALSDLFEVKANIFAEDLSVYLDSYVYLFDEDYKKYRDFLGFCFASYFDRSIDESEYEYVESEGFFINKGNGSKLKVICGTAKELLERAYPEPEDYLVMILAGLPYDESIIDQLSDKHPSKTFILTQEYVHLPEKGKKKEITDVVYASLVKKAKRMAGEL